MLRYNGAWYAYVTGKVLLDYAGVSQSFHGSQPLKFLKHRSAPTMLQDLPVMLLGTSPKDHLLFSNYSHKLYVKILLVRAQAYASFLRFSAGFPLD